MYKRLSQTEWQWQAANGKHHAVRYFERQGSLIWSSWIEMGDGPQFENGLSQKAADFLTHGAPATLTPPAEMLDELRGMLSPQEKAKKRGGLLRWLRS